MGFRIRDVELLYTMPRTIRVEFTYSPWVLALWDTAMGDQILADVVAGIFTGVASALQTVKDELSKAGDGIVAAGEYVGKTVISALFASLARMFNSVLAAQVMTFDKVSGDLTLLGVNADGTVNLDFLGTQRTIGISAQGTDLSIPFLGSIMHLDPIEGGYIETLGVGDLIGTLLLIIKELVTMFDIGAVNILLDFYGGVIIRSLLLSGAVIEAQLAAIAHIILSATASFFLLMISLMRKPASEMSMEELYIARDASWVNAMFNFGVSIALVLILGTMIQASFGILGLIIGAIIGVIVAPITGGPLSSILDFVSGDFSSLFNIGFKNNINRYESTGEYIVTVTSIVLGIIAGALIGGGIAGFEQAYQIFGRKKPRDLSNLGNLGTLPLIMLFLGKYLLLYNLFIISTEAFDQEIRTR